MSGLPQVLLLDLDGTLADSLLLMRQVYGKFLEMYGCQPTDAEFNVLNGPPLSEVVRILKNTHTLAAGERELLTEYNRLIDELYLSVEPKTGAEVILSRAQRHQCQVGVVTSNSRRRTESWLAQQGFDKSVTFVVSGEDVVRGKPNPEPYLRAIACSGCPATVSIAVEDSPQGAASAVAAGLETYLVDELGGHSTQTLPRGVHSVTSLLSLAQTLWPE